MIRPAAVVIVCALSCGPTKRATTTTATPPAPATSVAKPEKDPLRVADDALQVLVRVPAFDAVAADGRVFAFDPAVRALHGFDLSTGKKLWETPLGVSPRGRVRLYPAYGAAKRVLVHIENQLLLFDPKTGALASQHAGPWSLDRTRLSEEHGACSFSTDCDLHLVDCEDAHPYGPVLRIAVTHLYQSLGEPHDNVCWGPRLLLGRAGNVVVAVTDGRTLELPNTPGYDGPITLGVDVKSGMILWSTHALGCNHCASSGISRDGSTCFLVDPDGKLDAFACATGKLQFTKKVPLADSAPSVYAAAIASGLFLSTATEATLLNEKSGKTVWSTPLPPRALGLPLNTPLPLDRYSTWAARTVLLLDPGSGKEVARFDLPAYTELLQSSDLGLRVKGGPAFDGKGQKRAFAEEQPLFALVRETSPRLLRTGDGHKTLAEVTTDLAIVAARRAEGADELALFLWGPPGKPGELVFARLPRSD